MGTRTVMGSILRFAIAAGWYTPGEWGWSFLVAVVLMYIPKEWVFVVAGAWVAPRSPRTTASVLAVVTGVISLLTHLLMQQHVGWVNWMHFTAELMGAALGVLCVATWTRRESVLSF